MTQQFKQGDEVFIVPHRIDCNKYAYARPSVVSKIHKGNGNATVDGYQYRQNGFATGGSFSNAHIIHATDENKALVANAKALKKAERLAIDAVISFTAMGCETPDDVRNRLLNIVPSFDKKMNGDGDQ